MHTYSSLQIHLSGGERQKSSLLSAEALDCLMHSWFGVHQALSTALDYLWSATSAKKTSLAAGN